MVFLPKCYGSWKTSPLVSIVHFNCDFIGSGHYCHFYKLPANLVIFMSFNFHLFYIQVNKCLQGIQHQSWGECHSEMAMPSPLYTGYTGVPVVKAFQALVTALLCHWFGCCRLVNTRGWFPANGCCPEHDIKCIIPNPQEMTYVV